MLRRFDPSDADVVSSRWRLPVREAEKLIDRWNTCLFNGRYFEMYAIEKDGYVVGTLSLYEHSRSIISIGIEIFEDFRQRGLAKSALQEAMSIAKEKAYSLVVQQVRTDNIASMALHQSLGFEREDSVYKNQKGHDVFLYLKIIS